MTDSPNSAPDPLHGRSRPWPLYVLAGIVGLSAAGLAIGTLIVDRSDRGAPMESRHPVASALGMVNAPPNRSSVPPGRTSSYVGWGPNAEAPFVRADSARGAFVAQTCSACHGPEGRGSALAPRLAGQPAAVVWKQLEDFRSGTREWPVMNAVARSLRPDDIVAAAAYLSRVSGPPPGCAHPVVIEPPLVQLGDVHRLIPPCIACHSETNDYEVPMLAPRLEAQQADYLARQLQLFRSGWRQNDLYGHMRVVAHRLTDPEIQQLATRFAQGAPATPCSSSASEHVAKPVLLGTVQRHDR